MQKIEAGKNYFAAQMGLDEKIITQTLRQGMSRGGHFAELFVQHKIGNYISFEDGQVNKAYAQVDLGAGVRVLKGDQTGYAYTEDLSQDCLLEAAKIAASIAEGQSLLGELKFHGVKVPALYSSEPVWHDVAPPKKLSVVRRVGEAVLSADPSVIKASVQFKDEDEIVLIANTDGVLVEDVRPMTYLLAACTAEQQGRRESNAYSRSRRRGIDIYTERMLDKVASEAVRRTLLLFEAAVPPAGEMPVVLAPATSGILLHEAMGHGFEADFNRKKLSVFSSMMGQKVAADFVTIVDTALEPEARGAINVDDEGAPGRRTVLVENGKLVSYLHDRLSAQYFQVNPTGNGRRQDFRSIPLPRMRVTVMENGPHDPEEIVRSVGRGIYAIDFAGGEVAIGAGDYSFFVKTGYLIEDGKLTRPIKDTNLIGNGPDTLSKVVMVGSDKHLDQGTWTCGKDGQSVPVGLGLPTVKVSSITVGGIN